MGSNHNIDRDTLLALAQMLKAKGKIDRIDMESKSFRDMLVKEMKTFGKDFGNELGEWGKSFRDVFF